MSPQEALKMFRAETGLTQMELADKLHIGLATLNRWENSKTFPSRVNANNIIATAERMSVSKDCIAYLRNVLLPSRMRGSAALNKGVSEVDKDLLCLLADCSPHALFVIDAETKQLIYVNRRAEKIAGMRLADAPDTHWWKYMIQLDAPLPICCQTAYSEDVYYDMNVQVVGENQYRVDCAARTWKGKRIIIAYMTEIIDSL